MKHLRDRKSFFAINEVKVNDEDFGEDKKDHVKYEYGCVMLKVERNDAWNKVLESIADEDVFESEEEPGRYGIEKSCHITVLYGLHDSEIDKEEITKVITDRDLISLKMVDVSMFENEKYDVLKFGIESEDLKKFNADLIKFPYTNDYDEYVPHATIAYLKKGTGKKYVRTFEEEEFIELEDQSDVLYSRIEDGEKEKINLKIVPIEEEIVEESATDKVFSLDEIRTMIKQLDFMNKKIESLTSDEDYHDMMIKIENELGEEFASIIDKLMSGDVDYNSDYLHYHQNGMTVATGGEDTGEFLRNFARIKAFLETL